jgi:MinD-like ATPase involved in chromosome partitioning or flagellar assembly
LVDAIVESASHTPGYDQPAPEPDQASPDATRLLDAEVMAPVAETAVTAAPVVEVPVDSAPVEATPVEAAPVDDTPVEATPVDETLVQARQLEPMLLGPMLIEPIPIEPMPIEPIPIEPMPTEPIPIEPMPTEPMAVGPSPEPVVAITAQDVPMAHLTPAPPPAPIAPAPPPAAQLPPVAPPPPPPTPAPQPLPTPNQALDTLPRRAFTAAGGSPRRAVTGWRGVLARHGLALRPSESEMTERGLQAMVAQPWPGPRTIAVVNGKGGAGKTPATLCLAAPFARFGGTGVLAWDANPSRGTLGWRTQPGQHEATAFDLLDQAGYLLSRDAYAADISRFVHHQDRDHYDVLRSKPVPLADERRFAPPDIDAIWQVVARYYRLIILDSGNDESDPMWRRLVELSDQLVVVTTTRTDHAEAGALLLEALGRRDPRSAWLARNAVTVISQADPKASDESIRRLRDGFAPMCRMVVAIGYDPALVQGVIALDNLRPQTQRAWLTATAAVAQGLAQL